MRPPLNKADRAQPGWALLGLTRRSFTSALARGFHSYGIGSIPAFTVEQLLLCLDQPPDDDFDVIVLDRRLPPAQSAQHHADLVDAIRDRSSAAIVALAAQPCRDIEVEVTMPLEAPAEAVAATASILASQRRRRHAQLRRGPLLLNRSTWQAQWDETLLALTSQQFQLLEALAEAGGMTMTPEQLAGALYGQSLNGDTAAIRAHIGRLRRRLRAITPAAAEALLTVRGQGYRLVTR
jgi:DNA-binding response OmpR family regulator